MTALKITLNLPWTILGLVLGLISIPRKVGMRKKPFAIVISVRSFWWMPYSGVRGTTNGNTILLGPNLETKDLEHEIVHVTQYSRWPFIFAFMYTLETFRHGSRNNKYELEAYKTASNIYKVS